MGDGLVHTDMCDYGILSKNNNKYVSDFCCVSEYNQSMGYLYNIHQVFTPINVKSILTPGAQWVKHNYLLVVSVLWIFRNMQFTQVLH